MENLSYGYTRPTDIVVQLLVDDGNRSRDHRYNLLDPNLSAAGIAIAPHSVFGCMCAIALSVGFHEGPVPPPGLVSGDGGEAGVGGKTGVGGGYGHTLFPNANLANDETQPRLERDQDDTPSEAAPKGTLPATQLAESVSLSYRTLAHSSSSTADHSPPNDDAHGLATQSAVEAAPANDPDSVSVASHRLLGGSTCSTGDELEDSLDFPSPPDTVQIGTAGKCRYSARSFGV